MDDRYNRYIALRDALYGGNNITYPPDSETVDVNNPLIDLTGDTPERELPPTPEPAVAAGNQPPGVSASTFQPSPEPGNQDEHSRGKAEGDDHPYERQVITDEFLRKRALTPSSFPEHFSNEGPFYANWAGYEEGSEGKAERGNWGKNKNGDGYRDDNEVGKDGDVDIVSPQLKRKRRVAKKLTKAIDDDENSDSDEDYSDGPVGKDQACHDRSYRVGMESCPESQLSSHRQRSRHLVELMAVQIDLISEDAKAGECGL